MYRYGLHTVCHAVFELRRIPRLLRAPATKRPRGETAGDGVSPRAKWQPTKCTRDEMAGDYMCPRDEMAGDGVYPRRNGGDETQRRNVLLRWRDEAGQRFLDLCHAYSTSKTIALPAGLVYEA